MIHVLAHALTTQPAYGQHNLGHAGHTNRIAMVKKFVLLRIMLILW